jgi:hypothetical protein
LKRNRGLTTAIATALAVIITAGGMSPVGSVVLCVGSNGHADLELALELCCLDDATPRDDAGGESTASLVDSCGGCSDIGLDASSLTEGTQRLAPPNTAVMDLAGIFDSATVSFVDSDWGEGLGPPHLASLLSVVLLT